MGVITFGKDVNTGNNQIELGSQANANSLLLAVAELAYNMKPTGGPNIVDAIDVAIEINSYRIRSFLSIQYMQGNLCKHLGIDSSTDHPDDLYDRYSNLFLNAYINHHVHAKYL